MRLAGLFWAAAALSISASGAAQQQPAPSEKDDIIVEGKRRSIESALKQLIEPTDQGQLARFETGICPRVFGLPADWTEILTKTVRDNIVAAGATVGEPGCGPNAIVIFIYEPQKLIEGFGKALPEFFQSPAELKTLASRARPVSSWHVTDMKSRDGAPLEKVTQVDVAGSSLPSDAYVVRNAGVSRLYSNVREDMRLGFVVVDAEAIPGKSLRQLADLVTMHLLLDVRPDAGAHDPGSILSLFDARAEGAEPPLRMSQVDRAVLSGFYGLEKNNYTDKQQRRRIAKEAARQLKDGEE